MVRFHAGIGPERERRAFLERERAGDAGAAHERGRGCDGGVHMSAAPQLAYMTKVASASMGADATPSVEIGHGGADLEDAAEVIRQARMLNPELRVLARCAHLRDAPALERAGASVVAAGEAEVGVALVEAMTAGEVSDGGAQAAQRSAVRARLYSDGASGAPAAQA